MLLVGDAAACEGVFVRSLVLPPAEYLVDLCLVGLGFGDAAYTLEEGAGAALPSGCLWLDRAALRTSNAFDGLAAGAAPGSTTFC